MEVLVEKRALKFRHRLKRVSLPASATACTRAVKRLTSYATRPPLWFSVLRAIMLISRAANTFRTHFARIESRGVRKNSVHVSCTHDSNNSIKHSVRSTNAIKCRHQQNPIIAFMCKLDWLYIYGRGSRDAIKTSHMAAHTVHRVVELVADNFAHYHHAGKSGDELFCVSASNHFRGGEKSCVILRTFKYVCVKCTCLWRRALVCIQTRQLASRCSSN